MKKDLSSLRQVAGVVLVAGMSVFSSLWRPASSFSAEPVSVVINEIMYNPAESGGTCDDTKSEWVELLNLGSESVSLDGWEIGDSNSDGKDPDTNDPLAGAAIAGGGYLVVVADRDCFKLTYPDVQDDLIFELSDGKIGSGLNNSGSEDVVLKGPQFSDKVSYTSSSSASGKSYARASDNNWQLVDPTPGEPNKFPAENSSEEETPPGGEEEPGVKPQEEPQREEPGGEEKSQPAITFSTPSSVSAGMPFSVSINLSNFEAGTYSIKVLIGNGDTFYDGRTQGTNGEWLAWNAGWANFPTVTTGSSGAGNTAIKAKVNDDAKAGSYSIMVRVYRDKSKYDSEIKSLAVTAMVSAPDDSNRDSDTAKGEDEDQESPEAISSGDEESTSNGEVLGAKAPPEDNFKLNFYIILGVFGLVVGSGGLALAFKERPLSPLTGLPLRAEEELGDDKDEITQDKS